MLRLLCVTAHPDDEAGGFGGTLLLYRERNVETHVICLTPGQAGSHRGTAKSDDELAAMRKAEFQAACKMLKVNHGVVLNYPDSRLDRVNLFQIVQDLTNRIRAIRPQVVVTFGPEGAITAHPDHSMASIFATMAFHWAGRSNRYPEQLNNGLRPYRPQKLYYSTANFTLPDRQPVSLAPSTACIEIGDHFETKVQAFRAHTTQAPLFPIFENSVRKRGRQEMFHLVAAVTPRPIETETDLFAGIEDI